MEIADVRRRVTETIERARRNATERRERADEASHEYSRFLEHLAIPVFRQVANALKAQGYSFTVFTPGGSVRLMSDKAASDFIELSLDTDGDRPMVIGHSSRARGRRIIETEHPIADGPIRDLSDEQVLRFLLSELQLFVER